MSKSSARTHGDRGLTDRLSAANNPPQAIARRSWLPCQTPQPLGCSAAASPWTARWHAIRGGRPQSYPTGASQLLTETVYVAERHRRNIHAARAATATAAAIR